MGKLIDLTGQKFGRLTEIKRAENYISPSGQVSAQWLCKCDCSNDNEIIVQSQSLIKGRTKSCGCLARETTSKIKKKYNKYDLSGEFGIGYTFNDEEFYFDLEDYDKIKDYCWYKDKHGYICANAYTNGNNNHLKLHRIIMNCNNPKTHVDHKHGDNTRHDNRKYNLRIATPSQNYMNKGLRSDNTSGVTGVVWYKSKNKWRAEIMFNQNHIGLGYFDNFEDAVKARRDAEEKYFGEWSYNNSQTS